MRFTAIADTDIGISRRTNQDSILLKHAESELGEILFAVICDGMGGLSKGELASATVVRAFSKWFDEELPYELMNIDMQIIGERLSCLLKKLNSKILEYGQSIHEKMGTTFTGILFIENEYVIVHVGDSRIYHVRTEVKQLTMDHTYVSREVIRGTMTNEQARVDKRRNILLQCVGASTKVDPQIITGTVQEGTYMICSDGFYHNITENEMCEYLDSTRLMNKNNMRSNIKYLIDETKHRQEKDNISIILVKAEKGLFHIFPVLKKRFKKKKAEPVVEKENEIEIEDENTTELLTGKAQEENAGYVRERMKMKVFKEIMIVHINETIK